MVKPLYTLALRALQVNKEVAAHLTRVQHGFLPGKNIEQAHETLRTMQEMLSEMQEALNSPLTTYRSANTYVPMK